MASKMLAHAKAPTQKRDPPRAKPASPKPAETISRGNLAVQAKFATRRSDDPLEQEADHMAELVTSHEHTCAGCSADAPCFKCSNQLIQTSSTATRPPGGVTLSPSVRTQFEPHFGFDFSDVRTHDIPAHLARQQPALRAFTVGRDIAFASGEFAPHSESGGKLLAHELTHVIQQSGSPPQLQASGEFTEADMVAIREWLVTGETGTQPSPRAVTQAEADAALRQWLGMGRTEQLTSFGNPSTFFGRDPLLAHDLPDPGERLRRGPPPGYFCAGSHHQTPEQMWEAQQRREAERREEQRRAAWPGMHRAQHEQELRQQATTLREEIETAEFALAQLRLQMFDRVLQSAPRDVFTPFTQDAGATLTAGMRDAWIQAQQATFVLEALLRSTTEDLPSDVIQPIRTAHAVYYVTLTELVRVEDQEEQQLNEMRASIEAARLQSETAAAPCPRGCHEPNRVSAWEMSGYNRPYLGPLPGPQGGGGTGVAALSAAGPRRTNLDRILSHVRHAQTHRDWQAAIGDFRWATAEMDRVLRSRVLDIGGWDIAGMLEQFDYTKELMERQRSFEHAHPDAIKVQAIFYPEYETTTKYDERGGGQVVAKGIPWQFYLTHTPVDDPSHVPTGFAWELHDITAPKRENGRTVRTSYQVNALEALARERGPWSHPQRITEVDPPSSLFKELNHRDFFPRGMLYWTYPKSGRPGELEMTADTPFGDWLTYIGMAVAILASLVFAPFSTPMLIGVAVGTGLSIAGRAIRLAEMEEHGVLTQADVNRFYWDVALDIVSAMTLGLGRVATVAARAGNLVRAASAARAYMVMRRVQIGMDLINIGVVTADFIAQYRAIQDSNMSPEEKRSALTQLTAFAMLSGAMIIVPLRSNLRDLTRRPQLTLDVDPANPTRLVADLEAGAEAAHHVQTRTQAKATLVERIRVTHPDTNESHTYGLWSDGRITRCSGPPCPEAVESVVTRLDELGQRMLSDSAHAAGLQELLGRARRLREDAIKLAERGTAELTAGTPAILQRARAIDDEIVNLDRRVAAENAASERTGREEAELRWGAPALNYDTRYYRWIRRRDGRLQFQRRHAGVPWLEFDEASGSFRVTRTLFVPAEPARLRELQETSVTRDFPIEATISTIDDLRRLRPSSPYKRPPPDKFVLVRINDDNLVQFLEESIPHGVIFEFPDGSRVWRTRENTIATEGTLRAPIGRRGFEQTSHPQLRVTEEGESNLGVPVIESTGVEHQRAHPRGSGTGFELFNHIPLAPTYVNQQLQNRGIELFLAELNRVHPQRHFVFLTEHAKFPHTTRQSWIEYTVQLVTPTGRRSLIRLRIGTDYENPLRPAEYEIKWITSVADDLDLLAGVDMPAARAALDQRIRDARRRRAAARTGQ